DVVMPDCDGWSVLSALKADPVTKSVPVIILSIIDEKKRALQTGAAAVVAKPVDRNVLLRALNAIETSNGQQRTLHAA
ncbi:two-component system response regulator, partial [Streptomyces scabiei]|uniref:response regulator n=1 Tax=Streptomyces scabiei TaxID=1930 RepID=UPI0038F812FA